MIFILAIQTCNKKDIQPDYGRVWLPEITEPSVPGEIRDDYALEIDAERIELTREYLKIHNRVLFRQRAEVSSLESITFEPRIIVVHFTVIPTLEKVIDYFQPNRIHADREVVARNGALNVGVQFVVDRDGAIYRSYPETVIARHVIGLNHVAIGIENIGDGDLGSKKSEFPLTAEQLKANIRLVKYLKDKYPTIRFMIGHMEYQDLEDPAHPAHALFQEDKPDYRTDKIDPGYRFIAALRHALALPEDADFF